MIPARSLVSIVLERRRAEALSVAGKVEEKPRPSGCSTRRCRGRVKALGLCTSCYAKAWRARIALREARRAAQ